MSTAATRLAEAQAAYLSLLKGEQVRHFVDQNGEQVTYSRADVPMLAAYIRQLEFEAANGRLGSKGPLRPVF